MWRIGNKLAQIYSFILQPMLMPFYSMVLLFIYTNFFTHYPGQALRFLLPVLVFSFLVPSLFILLLVRLRYIRDLSLSDRISRISPYFIFIVSNLSLTYFFYQAHVFFWFLGLLAAPALVALVGMLINFFWKISAHMLGIGGIIGSVLAVCIHVKGAGSAGLFMILFILAGLLGVSRLYLRASTPAQVYVGFLVGAAVAYASIFGSLAFMISLLR